MDSEEIMEKAISDIANGETSALVGGFVSIGELHSLDAPGDVQYIYVTRGTPAQLLGLHRYLGMVLERDLPGLEGE